MTIKTLDMLVNGRPWAITPDMFDTIREIAERRNDIDAVMAKIGEPLQHTRNVVMRDSTAIIPIEGPIFPKANLFTEISGATSIEILALEYNKALLDNDVENIIIDIYSPGGNVVGINEFSNMVRDSEKPVVAYVGGIAASAAYWIASAADKIVIDKTAELGSIGTVMTVFRESDDDEIQIVSSQSPDKRPDAATDEGRTVLQANVDDLAQVFVETIAENRGLDVDHIISGRGRLFVGKNAIDFGLADEIGSLESVIAGLSGATTSRLGAIAMTGKKTETAQETPALTIESVRNDHPDIYTAIYESGVSDAKADLDAAVVEAREVAAKEALSDIDQIKAEAFTAGAEAERARIKAVEEQLIPGHEALINTLKYDGETTGEQAAVQVLQAVKQKGATTLQSIADNAPKPIPPTQDSNGVDPTAPLEDRCKAEWDKSADLRAEFGDSFDSYLAYRKNEPNVTVLSSKR